MGLMRNIISKIDHDNLMASILRPIIERVGADEFAVRQSLDEDYRAVEVFFNTNYANLYCLFGMHEGGEEYQQQVRFTAEWFVKYEGDYFVITGDGESSHKTPMFQTGWIIMGNTVDKVEALLRYINENSIV